MKTRFIPILMAVLMVAARVQAATDEVRFKAGEMGLPAYVEMFSDALGLNVNASTVDPGNYATVEVRDQGAMTRDQAMTQVLTVLFLRGYTLVHDPDLDTYEVVRLRDARDLAIPFVTDSNGLTEDDRFITYARQMRYFPVEEAARTLRSFAPANARLIPDEANNLMLITDASRSMKKYDELMARLDTPKAAEEAREGLRKWAESKKCDTSAGGAAGPSQTTLLVLYSLVALILGFLIRGYVIRRIEGGL